MSSDVLRELDKVKFHLRTIGEEIAMIYDSSPLGWLAIKMDWSEDDLNRVINTFYEYRKALKSNGEINLDLLKSDLMRLTSNNDDRVRDIIRALHKSKRFEAAEVCEKYAEANPHSDFHEILWR